MATTGIKYDDGTGGFASTCFPVRGLLKQLEDGGGAWITAQRAEQRRRFKAVLCSKPRTFEQIREERIKAEKDGTTIVPPPFQMEGEEDDDTPVLDGFYLMKHCCVEDPADLCSINISGKGLSDVKDEDFALFDNVAYVNASENYLPFDCFKSFQIIRELEMPLNGLRNLHILPGDYPTLEVLDLSYNNLSPEDLLPLGLIPNLRILHVTGNSLKSLPTDLAKPKVIDSSIKIARFPSLEILMADDNKLSDLTTFASLAGLRNLKHLNLSKNEIFSVPQLMLVEGRHVTQDIILNKKPRQKSGRRSRNTPRRKTRDSPTDSPRENGAEPARVGEGHVKAPPPSTREEGQADGPDSGRSQETDQSVEAGAGHPGEADGGMPTLMEERETVDDEEAFGELNLEELDAKVEDTLSQAALDTAGRNAHSPDEKDGAMSQRSIDDSLPPPFPELRYLNLSHNQLCEEESLLAVAAWPMLSELIIHDNPLTTRRSGDPPLLKRFLSDRLGIQLQRKPAGALEKPHIEIPQKADRKIKTKVPPIPRCNVEELLAIEAPKFASVPPPSTPPRSRGPTPSNPLPPIPPTPSETEGTEEEEEEEESAQEYGGDAFFMTQVDDPGVSAQKPPTPPVPHRPAGRREKRRPLPKQYRGYEALVENDGKEPSEDVPMPKDIQGNIRALQYALNHPLVFRENQVDLENRQKPFVPREKNAQAPSAPAETMAEKREKALANVRNSEAIQETPLETLLQDKQRKKHRKTREQRKEKDDAVKLLAQVQRRYNKVRVSSMKHAHSSAGSSRQLDEAQNILQDTIKATNHNISAKC